VKGEGIEEGANEAIDKAGVLLGVNSDNELIITRSS
jgi:hypothetical protein